MHAVAVLSATSGYQRTETTRRTCDPAARIRVENDAGLIEMSAWEPYKIEVVARKHAPDEASLDLLEVDVAETPEGILVSYTAPESIPDAWVDFVIRCPRMAALDVHNASGEILLSGFHAQSRAATASGTIRAARMRGTSTLTSASGAIDGAALEGTVYARSASGRVNLHGNLTGSHRVETASGDIIVDGVKGSIDARSASGAIDVQGQLSDPSALRTVSGNITVRLQPGSELAASGVRAETTSGQVDVQEARRAP
jgi:hypothetical protein